jgi:hypothetical protein
MRWKLSLTSTTLVLAVTAATAAAQPPLRTPYEPPVRCSSLDVFGGVSMAESGAGALAGGAAGWQFTPRFGLEGDAFWLDRPGSETGFGGALHARWNLVTGWRTTPYLKAGAGLYHASIESTDDAAPAFYRDRLEQGSTDVNMTRSFTDPAVIAGAGVDILLSRRLSLRPQAAAMFVFDHGQSRVMPALTLHLAFHFEEHPITSARK